MADPNSATRKCRRCNLFFPLIDGFHKSQKGSNGYSTICKKCRSMQQKERRALNPERVREVESRSRKNNIEYFNSEEAKEKRKEAQKKYDARKYGTEKYKKQKRNDYIKHKERHLAACKIYYEKNKQAYIDRARQWKMENPDKVKSCNSAYREKFPEKHKARKQNRRAREKNAQGRLDPRAIAEIKQAQKNRCAICNVNLTKFHVDHINPLSAGGSNMRENIQILCPTCNLSKGAKDPIEFMQSKGFLL